MKKLFSLIVALILTSLSVACDNTEPSEFVNSSASSEAVSSVSSAENDNSIERATGKIKTESYKNSGKMGDTDGPAFAVYSNVGYNGASVELDLSKAEINTVLPDNRYINAYSFLGIDVYEGAYWQNCADAGLCWSGTKGGWHLFYNIYETLNENTASWYESRKILPKNAKYRLTLKLTEDNYAVLTVEGITNGFKDSVKIEIKGAKKDGSNTAFLFNSALDYPPDTKLDSSGKPSEDFAKITLANSDKGLYFRNLHSENGKLYKNGEELKWTEALTAATSIWPDKAISGFDYSPTEVYLFDGSEFLINFDMNRK